MYRQTIWNINTKNMMSEKLRIRYFQMKRVAGQSGRTSDTLGYRKGAQHFKLKENKNDKANIFYHILFTDLIRT